MAEVIHFAGRSLELEQTLTGPEMRILLKSWNKRGGHDDLVVSVLRKCFRDHDIEKLSKRQLAGLFLRVLEHHQKKRRL